MAMKYEDALELVGPVGRYQIVILLMSYLSIFPLAFNNMAIVFLGASPDHWCSVPEVNGLNLTLEETKNLTLPLEEREGELRYSQCQAYTCSNWTHAWAGQDGSNMSERVGCEITSCQHGWTYDRSVYTSTIVTEWDLVCGRKHLEAMSQSVYMAGLMLGAVGSGIIADMYGRKVSIAIGMLLCVPVAIGTAFSKNFVTFVLLRCVLASGVAAWVNSAFVASVELMTAGPRMLAATSGGYFWVLGSFIVGALGYALRDWRYFLLSFAAPSSVFFLFLIVFPESPRWLYNTNRRERGEKILRNAAKWNNRTLPEKLEIELDASPENVRPWDLCRYSRMRIRTLVVCLNWLVVSMVWYGLSLNTSRLGGDDHINYFISCATEIPAAIFVQLTMDRYGRRCVQSFAMLSGGLALLFTLAVPAGAQSHVAKLALTMLGKFSMSVAFTNIFVYTAELFPTTVRNIGMGVATFWARIGGIIAPQIAMLGLYQPMLPSIVFGSLAIIAGLAGITLPETARRRLPETLIEAENFGRGRTGGAVSPAETEMVVSTLSVPQVAAGRTIDENSEHDKEAPDYQRTL